MVPGGTSGQVDTYGYTRARGALFSGGWAVAPLSHLALHGSLDCKIILYFLALVVVLLLLVDANLTRRSLFAGDLGA